MGWPGRPWKPGKPCACPTDLLLQRRRRSAAQQVCRGELIRKRTLTGICNDQLNPLMGSTGQLFARNVEFDTTFPDQGLNPLTANRHGGRLSLLIPDPQVISRRLFTRQQTHPEACGAGYGAAIRHNPIAITRSAVLQCSRGLLDSVHDA